MAGTTRWCMSTLGVILSMSGSAGAQTDTSYGTTHGATAPQAAEPSFAWVRSEVALGSKVTGSGGENIGDINDLIISRHSGRVIYALVGSGGVLGIGERVVAVPFGAMKWREHDRVFNLPMTKERLNDAPSLGRDEWKQLADSPRARTSSDYFGVPAEPIEQPPAEEMNRGSRLSHAEWPLLRVSDIDNQKLTSNEGQELGKIDEVILDANSGRVGFVVVTFGGTLGFGAERAPIPWSYFDVNSDGHLFAMNLDKEKIRAAPRLSSADGPELRDPKFGARIYSHYGLNAPWLTRPAAAAQKYDSPDIKQYNQLYASGSESTISGSIVSIEDSAPMPGVPPVTVLTVKSPAEGTVVVHLAPKWYLDEQRIVLRKGDNVTINGRHAECNGKRCLIAAQVTPSDGSAVILRRKGGDTTWTWR
ncbi:MAG: PRC-barrel domain-containing protein [Phycisphaerae bacterium]|nr:PRC-barrel domain-containing protein [Phycisphaerae bacterium]